MNNNEYKQSHETVCMGVTILDTSVEQTAERDLVLPDYYPDIFRILRCTAQPRVVSQSVSGKKLSFELEVAVTILYCSEGSKGIACVEQRLPLSRTIELESECRSPLIHITSSCGDMTCRVVNKRRLDIRGIVTSRVRVTGEKDIRVLSDARGCGVQLRKETVRYPVKRLGVAKRITVIEELELGEAKPAMGTALRCGCVINKGEDRMIAGKLVTKGEAELTVVYTCVTAAGEEGVETMRFTLPFSQIIDVEGIDESFSPVTEISCTGCTVTPKGEEGRRLECELVLNVLCRAVKYKTGELVCDGYFTGHEEKCVTAGEELGGELCEKILGAECSASVDCPEGVSAVTDCYAVCRSATLLRNNLGGISVTGTAEICIMGVGSEGMPFLSRETAAFETDADISGEYRDADLTAEPVSCTYILSDDRKAQVRTKLRITLRYTAGAGRTLLTSLEPDLEKPLTDRRPYALKLCRCSEGEELWDIAKRCRTSLGAIEEANAGEDKGGLLLIPIV